MRNLTPSKTPSKTPFQTQQRRTPRRPTEEEETRQIYFLHPIKHLIEVALSGGYLLDWAGTDVDLECPQPFFWYCHCYILCSIFYIFVRPAEKDKNGQEHPIAIDVSCFNDAFQIYDFEIPLCPCNTQDKTSDLAKRRRLYTFNIFVCRNSTSAYFGNVLMSCKKQRAGCDVFSK
ncbi:MAG TPA: hypothetical protein VGO47_15000 [Chlamydiales bacterium]|jgi:hypothetical protein|nr:hypothetical protein [Chlamydiales bacterium]